MRLEGSMNAVLAEGQKHLAAVAKDRGDLADAHAKMQKNVAAVYDTHAPIAAALQAISAISTGVQSVKIDSERTHTDRQRLETETRPRAEHREVDNDLYKTFMDSYRAMQRSHHAAMQDIHG